MSVSFIQKPARNSPLVANHSLRRGLTAAWRFDEHSAASGAVLKDSVKQKTYDATFPATRISLANTRYGRVMDRDSTRDAAVVTITNAIALPISGTAITFSIFLRSVLRTVAPENYCIACASASYGDGFGINLTGGANRWNYFFGGADHLFTGSATLNKWHNVLVSCNDGTMTLFVDGVKDATTVSSVVSHDMKTFGSDPSNERWDGQWGCAIVWGATAIGQRGATILQRDPFTLWRPQPRKQAGVKAPAATAGFPWKQLRRRTSPAISRM